MKALTICQPFAESIAYGHKRVENRNWSPPASLVGKWFAVHAGKSRKMLQYGDEELYPEMVFGAIVAVVRMERWWTCGGPLGPKWDWVRNDPDALGPCCWILGPVIRLKSPVFCRGRQKLWEIPAEVSRSLIQRIPLDQVRATGFRME